jgi:glutamate/tyrosine decarboxylase-like PLP-dependent enzyme
MNEPDEHRAQVLRDAAARAARYLETAADRPVAAPEAAIKGLSTFPSELPAGPSDPAAVVDLLDRVGSPATTVNTHGRYFGFVTGGTHPAAAAAAVLAGTWDQNTALPVMSPVGTHLDALAARWVVDLLGLPPTAVATFCGGATIANLTCLLAARDALLARAGWSVAEQGVAGSPPLRVVATAEVHVSVLKALRAAGVGTASIELVATDGCGRLVAGKLPALDARTIVVLQAGNVNTGHSDPFVAAIPEARSAGAWVHVDGAFGLWAAASPQRRALLAGVDAADSWATDAHKWLNAPYDAGIAVCARAEDLRRALATDAAYVSTDADRALMHLSLQMSQRARGIETWAVLMAEGRAGLAALVDRHCDQAVRFAERLAAAGAQILAPVVLNQLLVRFGDDTTTDAVVAAVQADGTCWVGGTSWQGRRAMRISVSDMATTDDDIDTSAAAVLRCWEAVGDAAVG